MHHLYAWALARCGLGVEAREALDRAEALGASPDEHLHFQELVQEALEAR